MLDIDCHNAGSPAGAAAFASCLQANVFPGLYYEPSTNGKGVHGYVIVQRDGRTAAEVGNWIRMLQTYLRQFEGRFDVEMLEVKGHPMQVQEVKPGLGWRITGVTCGQLAKLPRQLLDRWGEFQKTTRISIQNFDLSQKLGGERAVERKEGSFDPKLVKDIEIAMPIAKTVMGGDEKFAANDKIAVVTGDVAMALVLLHAISRDMNEDGSLPTARVRSFWDAVVDAGDYDRSFHPARWRAIRDRLDQCGLLEWVDNTYLPGRYAMKWTLKSDVVAELDALVLVADERRERTFISTSFPVQSGKLVSWKPEDEITRSELYQLPIINNHDLGQRAEMLFEGDSHVE